MSLPGRRRFLFGAGAVGLGLLGLRSRVDPVVTPAFALPTSAGIELPETLRVLSVPEYFTLSAACERVFPRDDTPGAIDLGAPVYIDRALAVRPLPVWADDFRGGLARRRRGRPSLRGALLEGPALGPRSDADGLGGHG